MVGGIKKPLLNASAVEKIVEVVQRWKLGPDMETRLDRLQFLPNMKQFLLALEAVQDSEAHLSLFRWAKRQSWYCPSHDCYEILFDKLKQCRDYDGIQFVFDDMVAHSTEIGMSYFSVYNLAIQYLAKAQKLELALNCYKKIKESSCKLDTLTYNSLLSLFVNKGLAYKAFEIYENMEAEGCLLDALTYELMIPTLAKSGRLDSATRLFQQMKERNFPPAFGIFASLVDFMGKAGRLDTSMKVYMEMQGFGLKPSATMYVSMIESFVKAGKLDTALGLWDEMKKAGFRPNYGLYTIMVEFHAKSGKLEIAMSTFCKMFLKVFDLQIRRMHLKRIFVR